MNQRIEQLLKRLSGLGYRSFEIKNIMQEAVGNRSFDNLTSIEGCRVIQQLEHYAELGQNYIQAYSK